VRLETERLVIRRLEERDADAWIEMLGDPQVRRFLPDFSPPTRESVSDAIERRDRMERERGHTMWAVALKTDDRFIGQCGLVPVEGEGPEIEIAYHYRPESWGHGYATEAAVAVLSYGFETVELDRVIAVVMPDNVSSGRVLEKAGMRYEGLASYYGFDGVRKYGADRKWWRLPGQ
jgi:RimJ/RimL family protein N-acetyltransferase